MYKLRWMPMLGQKGIECFLAEMNKNGKIFVRTFGDIAIFKNNENKDTTSDDIHCHTDKEFKQRFGFSRYICIVGLYIVIGVTAGLVFTQNQEEGIFLWLVERLKTPYTILFFVLPVLMGSVLVLYTMYCEKTSIMNILKLVWTNAIGMYMLYFAMISELILIMHHLYGFVG